MREAFIVDYVRTPIGRYGGALSGVRADDLAAVPLRALMARNAAVDWTAVDEVILGAANQAGEDNRNIGRMAGLLAGFAERVPGVTVNRLCGSGMEAVSQAARAIKVGEADLVVAGGAESMSRAPFVVPKADAAFAMGAEIAGTTLGWRLVNPRMESMGHTDAMGITAENVAAELAVSREDQDAFALRSQQRTAAAIARGFFAGELTDVETLQRGRTSTVSADEHPRADTTLESLARLRPAFRPDGSVTAGNSSGINDGAAALLLASEAAVERFGLQPIARVLGAATAGVAPRLMGMGPVAATALLLERLGLTVEDFDTFELNEAFASQALACLRALRLADDDDRANANGGAIALGHPLGMSGARLVGTAARTLAERGGRRALATMCIGVGQGIALGMERV